MKNLLALAALLVLATSAAAADNWLTKAQTRQVAQFEAAAVAGPAEQKSDRRGKVVIRRAKPQCKSDWNTDPTALPYLYYQIRERTQGKFPIKIENEPIELGSKEMFDYPLVYFTSHYSFEFSDEEVENLKKYVARGGTLWLDDCTGTGPFMDSVPTNVQRIIPGAEMKLMLKQSKAYEALFHLIYHLDGLPEMKEQFMQPMQCAYLKGRPCIQACPNDYGCDWEVSSPPTALNPLGNPAHDQLTPTVQKGREEVYQFSINWLFFAITH